MLINEIKKKAWKKISKYNNLDDEGFNNSAITFKISNDYNLVIWCDIDYEIGANDRYYIVSVRFNPHDDIFGDDIGAEYSTMGTTQEELEKAIDYVLSHRDVKF